jgi:hypothetical protein
MKVHASETENARERAGYPEDTAGAGISFATSEKLNFLIDAVEGGKSAFL